MPNRPDPREIEIFLDATELDPTERDAFLRSACGGDPVRESRVRELLAAHDGADEIFGDAPMTGAPPPGSNDGFVDELEPNARIAGFRLVQEIAEGGFGTVWLAEQREPVRRRVALKVLKPGMDCREVIARFEAERQALALMDHPNIARVFDGGSTDKGRPYFVMEYVPGEPITTHCERHSLDTEARLELFKQVCDAVQHAHQKGVIHRDLKPSNVLVTLVDGEAVPKVIDFGIAKATEARLTEKTLFTRGGQMIGTPAYMSPEQAEGSLDVDVRSDVYALGVLLYELLSGSTPFDTDTLRSAGLAEVLRLIREVEPPRPSTRIDRLQTGTRSQVRARQVKGDLDWIVMCCLEKERERRYGSVAVLRNEIRRHLRGDPVQAGPPSLSYRVSKFARKHRVGLVAAALLLVTLVSATIVSWTQADRANEQAEIARSETLRANLEVDRYKAIATLLEHLISGIDPSHAAGKDTELLETMLSRARKTVEEMAAGQPRVQATLRKIIGKAYLALTQFVEAGEQMQRALAIQERELGANHTETVETAYLLGCIRLQEDRADAAAPLLRRGWEHRRVVLGPEHEDTIGALAQLATSMRLQKRWEESKALLRELEAHLSNTLKADDPELLRVRNNLATTLEDLGELEAACKIFEEVLALQAQGDGFRLDTLRALNNLASIYRQLDRDDEAIAILERALALKKRFMSEGHASVLIGMNNLADALWPIESRRDEAIAMWRDALRLAQEHHGERSHLTLSLRMVHGRLKVREERFAEAEPELRSVLALVEEHLGPNHRLVPSARSTLVDALLGQERFEDALPIALGLPKLAERILPRQAPSHGVYRIQLGLALVGAGRGEDARQPLEAGLERLPESSKKWRERAQAALDRIRTEQN